MSPDRLLNSNSSHSQRLELHTQAWVQTIECHQTLSSWVGLSMRIVVTLE